MIIVDPNRDFNYFVDRLSTDRVLTAKEETAVLAYITANCSGLSVRALVEELASSKIIPNPTAQTSSMVIITTELDRSMKVLIRKGLATLADFEEETIIWDSNWQPTIVVPSPLEQLGFEPGAILTERDIRKII